MAGKLTQPLENYALAFQTYLNESAGEFRIKTNGVFLVFYEDITFRVIHYDDLVWQLKNCFTGSYTRIYTDISFGLWFLLYDNYEDISEEDLFIDLYKAWQIYWDKETFFNGTAEDFAIAKQHGWEDFELFLAKIKADPEEIVQSAIDISELHLIPIIALAMRMRFANQEDFYSVCIAILVEAYPHVFGIVDFLEEINLDPENPGTQVYFIGETDIDFLAHLEFGED